MVIKAFMILISPGPGGEGWDGTLHPLRALLLSRAGPAAVIPLSRPSQTWPAFWGHVNMSGVFHLQRNPGAWKQVESLLPVWLWHVNAPLWAAGSAPVQWEYWWRWPLRLLIRIRHCAWQRASAPSGFALLIHTTVSQVPCQVLGGERQWERDPALRILGGYQGRGRF